MTATRAEFEDTSGRVRGRDHGPSLGVIASRDAHDAPSSPRVEPRGDTR